MATLPCASQVDSSLPDPGRMIYGPDTLAGKTEWNLSGGTRMTPDSGNGRQLA